MLKNTNKHFYLSIIIHYFGETLKQTKMDLSKIDNIDFWHDPIDYPDFADAFILHADYDGVEMTEDQLNGINNNSEFIHEKLMESLN
jgi:hypothetical protein